MKKLKAHMICHTHWDREWYLTREQFRTKLVRLIDGLLDLVEEVPEYVSFMLDGQTIAIEDYLEIKPYCRERLFNALKTGKIICGPWYVLPDELLISGESHIRNYLKGAQVTAEAGHKMETAYLPDSFGHPAQMPQIAVGLGMHTMVFWRGASREMDKTEFYWESPFQDSRVLCIHMPHGYGNSGNLSSDMDITVPRVKELLESLGAKSTTDVVLLMNGSDHIIGQKDICEVVRQLNEQIPECCIELSTMENYLNELREQLEKRTKGSDPFVLSAFRGEIRSGECSMLLGGTLSSRMYLKQRNDIVQNKAERYLEPLLALEKLSGREFDSCGYLDYIWKKILENHPHDSICGCSIDEVHREMMTRYACVEQLEDTLMHDTVVRNETKGQRADKRAAEIALFEPCVKEQPAYAELEICMDETLVQSVDYTKSVIVDCENSICHPDIPAGIRITDEAGRKIPHVILEAKKDYNTLYQDHTMPEIYKVNKFRVGVMLPGFTYGCHQLTAAPSDEPSDWAVRTEGSAIENEFYRLSAGEKGLILLDKRTQAEHEGFARMIDKGDAGDEYTYSWPEEDRECTIDGSALEVEKEIQEGICQALILRGNMILPEALSEDRRSRKKAMTKCSFAMKITLYSGINRIDCHLDFENNARDHRLQVQFPSGIRTKTSESYQIFDITERPVEVEVPEKWMEYPQSTHPNHGYVGVHDNCEAMSVGTTGLPEYEAVQTEAGTAVNLTLLRCVGWLSRTDLLTRHGNGGWIIETEEAQCIGNHSFDFCVVYHPNRTAEAFDVIERFRCPVYTQSLKNGCRSLLAEEHAGNFMNKLPEGVQLSALKISERQDGVILRIYSILDDRQEVVLPVQPGMDKVYMANLAEEKQKKLEVRNGEIRFEIKPGQIITLYIETKP